MSDIECKLRLKNDNKKNAGTHRIDSRSRDGIEVEAITIDSLNLDNVDLIHLDLESYEDNAIRGAINTIKRCRPVIISEKDILSLFTTLEQIGRQYVPPKLPNLNISLGVKFGKKSG